MKLPACAEEYIKLIVKKMRFHRKIRQDVQNDCQSQNRTSLSGTYRFGFYGISSTHTR